MCRSLLGTGRTVAKSFTTTAKCLVDYYQPAAPDQRTMNKPHRFCTRIQHARTAYSEHVVCGLCSVCNDSSNANYCVLMVMMELHTDTHCVTTHHNEHTHLIHTHSHKYKLPHTSISTCRDEINYHMNTYNAFEIWPHTKVDMSSFHNRCSFQIVYIDRGHICKAYTRPGVNDEPANCIAMH